jgi:thiol:disulfide interchange protein DsbA
VAEFFWYACRHCYALEPHLAQWLLTRPAHVEFVRIPVAWGPSQEAHARLFYTLRALGRENLDPLVFAAIHEQANRLTAGSEQEALRLQLAFAQASGIPADEFRDAWRSPAVQENLARARELTRACGIHAVPAIVVNGEYRSTAGRAGGKRELVQLLDHLVGRALARAP